MNKKIVITMLVAALCLLNAAAMAKQDKNPVAAAKTEVTVNTEQTTDEGITNNEDADNEDKSDEEKDKDIEQVKENNGKSKVIKEELAAKKQERAQARLEAKEYINNLRQMFKDADKDTKKEILKEIAGVKKELKDYSIGVFVKGLVVNFEKYDNVKPVIKNDRTLVPLRAITETLGADVDWNEETSTITITKDGNIIIMQIDNKTATVNGKEVELEVAPAIENNRTLVPLRFISENLKLNVEWDNDSQTVVIEEQ